MSLGSQQLPYFGKQYYGPLETGFDAIDGQQGPAPLSDHSQNTPSTYDDYDNFTSINLNLGFQDTNGGQAPQLQSHGSSHSHPHAHTHNQTHNHNHTHTHTHNHPQHTSSNDSNAHVSAHMHNSNDANDTNYPHHQTSSTNGTHPQAPTSVLQATTLASTIPEPVHEQPFYVNAKQYHRILKRRIARAKLEESLKVARGRRPYLHESRHKHAMRRPRGQGGRFLTAAEIAERDKLEKQKKEQEEQQKQQALQEEQGELRSIETS